MIYIGSDIGGRTCIDCFSRVLLNRRFDSAGLDTATTAILSRYVS